MARVSIVSLADGVVWQGNPFAPAAGATANVYIHGTTTRVTVFSDETSGTTLTQPLTANASGILPGWIDAQQDVDIQATYGGVTSAATLQSPLRASDLIGSDGLIGGAGSIGLTGGRQTAWVSHSGNYTMLSTDSGVLATASLTVTLPASPQARFRYSVKVGVPGITVTVSTGTTGQIDNGMGGPGTSETLTVLGQTQDYQIAPNGSDWLRV